MDDFNKDLCNERHEMIDKRFEKIDTNIAKLFGKLDWFYIIAIATLIGVVANYFKG